MNKNDQKYLVQKIRTQYTEKEHSSIQELKKLDRQVKRSANGFSYIFGSIGIYCFNGGLYDYTQQ